LRSAIVALGEGIKPPQPTQLGRPVPTYGGDTVLKVPALADQGNDRELVLAVSRCVAQIYQQADGLSGERRDDAIMTALKAVNVR
jgi:hypothetical protein